jgi:dihydroorotate dehydrogenase
MSTSNSAEGMLQTTPHRFVDLLGLDFPNPIGLAAGFDRDASLLESLAQTDFGFVEIGTVNFPLSHDACVDLDKTIANIEKARTKNGGQLLGVSLGSLNETLNTQMLEDYRVAMTVFWHSADYLVINLSRPDSPARCSNLNKEDLKQLLLNIRHYQDKLTEYSGIRVPVLIKLALEQQTDTPPLAIQLAKEIGLDAVTVAFEGWGSREHVISQIQKLHHWLSPLPLIAVGGIRTAEDAEDYIRAGADLVQLFTGMVEQGPSIVSEIVTSIQNEKFSIDP